MKAAIAKLREKGYWQAQFRPLVERQERWSDKLSVAFTLRDIAVNFRGWDYPHVSLQDEAVIERNCVWQQTHWEHFHELWCAFQSGQFFHIAGMRGDYGAKVHFGPMEEVPVGTAVLGIGDALFRMTEFVHFASRYAGVICPGESLRASLLTGGLTGRHLVIDDPGRGGTSVRHVYGSSEPHVSEFEVPVGASHAELGKKARELALELFERFGFRTSDRLLEGWQAEMVYYRPT